MLAHRQRHGCRGDRRQYGLVLERAGRGTVDLTNPAVIAGVADLVAGGIITSADQTTLLA
jgi:hypothetical protein